ncbi:MAG: hypothetical protein NT034_01055 [Candidatus Magasanikbacteria bacterium]|nr:hypothetical protein [Candidatus Magasanikbacteria bacterium]
MEIHTEDSVVASSEVIERIRSLGLVRISATHLEALEIVQDGQYWVKILLQDGHLRSLSPEEIANSRLRDVYDVVSESGKVAVQKDVDRSATGNKKKTGLKDNKEKSAVETAVRSPPIKADPKWVEFWFTHPDFRCSPILGDLYILSKGQDVDYPSLHECVMKRNVTESWFSSRMHRGRKLGQIDFGCRGARNRPLQAILWHQDQVPSSYKTRLARLLEEFRTKT